MEHNREEVKSTFIKLFALRVKEFTDDAILRITAEDIKI